MGFFSSKPKMAANLRKEKAQEPSTQVSGQDPVEEISMSTSEKVVMRTNMLQPSDFPSLNFDQLMMEGNEILKHEQSTVIDHSLDVKGQHLELSHYAHSFDEVLDGELKRVNEVTKVCDLNGCWYVFWQDTAYSESWRSHRVISHGRQGHKTCYKAWKKLWAPKLSQKELFNNAGHGPVNNMNPWIF
jgi:hypothetical protein